MATPTPSTTSTNRVNVTQFDFKNFRFVDKCALTENLDIALMRGLTQPVSFALLVNTHSGATPAFMHFDITGRVYTVGYSKQWEPYTRIDSCYEDNQYEWVYPYTGQTQRSHNLYGLPDYRILQDTQLLIAETFLLDVFSQIKDEFLLRFK